MSLSITEKEKYRIAKLEQDFFRDAINHCMAGDVDKLDKIIKEFLANNKTVSANDLFAGFQTEGRTLVHFAANSGHPKVLDLVLGYCDSPKSFINLSDERGFSPLINATISESDIMMSTLIKLGADVNRRNKDGAAAIHFAAGDGGVSRMQILFDAGADLNAHSNFGGSPIHWAAGKGRAEAIAFLIAHGVDVNTASPEGVPPVIMASVSACDLGVKHLVDAGADVGSIVSGGLTALHICSEHGLLAAVNSILNTANGVNSANLETVDGNKPIHLAAMSAHREVVRSLLAFTAGLEITVESEVEAQIDTIIADGKVRLQQWESKYNPSTAHVSATGTTAADLLSPPSIVSPEDDMSAEKLKDVGNNLFKKAAYAAAIKAYTSAIEINRYNATYFSNRSAAYLMVGDNQNALQDAEMCRRLKPDWTKGCYRLGAARLALGLYEDAAVAAFEGCKLDDKNEELKVLLKKCVKEGQDAHKKKLAENAATSTSK